MIRPYPFFPLQNNPPPLPNGLIKVPFYPANPDPFPPQGTQPWRRFHNPSVTGVTRSGQRFGVKAKSLHGLGVPVPPWRDWNPQALVSSGTGRGPRPPPLLWRKLSPFTGAMGLPADASGASRPNPQATTNLAPHPSSLKGYTIPKIFVADFPLLKYKYRATPCSSQR